jgi:hypothetical protein
MAETKKGENTPNIILEVELDSGTVKWGEHAGFFDDVAPVISRVSSLQNKINQREGFTSRGKLSFNIIGRDNFKNLMRDEFLKNRRVTRKDGFINSGFAYSDYAATFTGRITEWKRKGDVLTITVDDDLVDGKKKIPVENDTKTQSIDFTGGGAGVNPVDVMQDIIKTHMGVSTSLIDDVRFDSEQADWLNSWKVSRTLTDPSEANKYLNELQVETNSFIVHDGEKISYTVFAPSKPGQVIEGWTDNDNILQGSMTAESGYTDAFFNRVVVYFDWDEGGSDGEANFDSAVIIADADSQSAAEWNETKSKVIKSKWIKSFSHTATSNITGVTLYHVSKSNGVGNGTLTFNQAANTLTWTAPGGGAGETVKLSKNGKFQIFDTDKTKFCRVVVETASLPGGNQSDSITISTLAGDSFATTLAQKLLSRYRNPSTKIKFRIDVNNMAFNSIFIKPTDQKDITTDDAFEKGDSTWLKERVFLTSVRPDFTKQMADVEAIEMKTYNRYGFIAPAGFPDYTSATDTQKEYAFVGSTSNLVGGTDRGYFIW